MQINCRIQNVAVCVYMSCIFLPFSGLAQQPSISPRNPQSASRRGFTPPVADPDVFCIYLREAHRTISEIGRASPEGLSAVETTKRAASSLHVEVGDLAALERAYQKATSATNRIAAQTRGYAAGMTQKGQTPEIRKLLEFDRLRRQAIQQIVAELRSSMVDANWYRLQAFLDGEFRNRIKRRAIR